MAKRRTKKRTHSAAPRVQKAVKTARRRRKRSRGLADAFSPAKAKAAAIDMVQASLGGLATAVIEKGVGTMLTGNTGKLATSGLVIASSFIAHAVMNKPAVSAGMIGAAAYGWSKQIPGLNDDAAFADEDVLADEPDAFAEDGTPLYLSESGDLVSMDEMEFAEYEEMSEEYV